MDEIQFEATLTNTDFLKKVEQIRASINAVELDVKNQGTYAPLIGQCQDYINERLALEKKFNETLEQLEKDRQMAQERNDLAMVAQLDHAIAELTVQRAEVLMKFDLEQLNETPDFTLPFKNLKQTSAETLNSLLAQLGKVKAASENMLKPDSLEIFLAALKSITDTNSLDSDLFQKLFDQRQDLSDARDQQGQAEDNLVFSLQQAEAVKGGALIETGVKSTKIDETTGEISSEKSYMTENQALEQVVENTQRLNEAKKNVESTNTLVVASEKAVEAKLNSMINTIKVIGTEIKGPAGEIISLIGEVGTFTMDAMSGVKMAAKTSAEAIGTIEKASVILAIIGAAVKLAMKVASMFGANYDEYDKAKKQYESYIKVIDNVIAKQKELIGSMKTTDYENARNAYEYGLSLVKKSEASTRTLGRERLNSGASAGSHAIGTRIRKGMSREGWDEAKEALGQDFDSKGIGDGRMTGLFDLSIDQLSKLQMEAPTFWAKLDGDVQGYLEKIIACGESSKELKDQLNESLTGMSFNGFYDNFVSTLSDMNSTSQDFANDFEKYLQQAIINSLMRDKYQERIKILYQSWSDKTYSGGLSQDEVEALKKEEESIVNDMLADRENLAKTFKWDSNGSSRESSSQKGFSGMSQDTGNELNGRFTALQIAGEDIRNSMSFVVGHLTSLSSSLASGSLTLSEMRNLAVISNSYLHDIAGFSKKIYVDFGTKLDSISANTERL